MTVKELIEKLQECPQDAIAVTFGSNSISLVEFSNIEHIEDENYFDLDDQLVKGNIVII